MGSPAAAGIDRHLWNQETKPSPAASPRVMKGVWAPAAISSEAQPPMAGDARHKAQAVTYPQARRGRHLVSAPPGVTITLRLTRRVTSCATEKRRE
jgi:hypothetical protein